MSKNLQFLVLFVVNVLLLLWVALVNQFPIITQDSAAYLNMAYTHFYPSDRPMFYGLFIEFVSITKNIWWPVIAQAVLLSFLMLQLLRFYINDQLLLKGGLIIVFVALLTPVSWIVSQITADIFIAFVILSAILFFITTNKYLKIVYFLILGFSLLTHNSYLIAFVLFASTSFLLALLLNRTYLLKTTSMLVLSIMVYFTLSAANYKAGNGFTFSKAGHVFFMGKLVECGILKAYLDDHCDKENYQLCAFKDSLPKYGADFIWQEGKAFHKTGGWDNSKPEYSKIINGTFTEWKFLKMHIHEAFFGTINQIGLTYVGDLRAQFTEDTHPYNYVQLFFPHQAKQMLNARQQKGTLYYGVFKYLYPVFLLLMLIATLRALFLSKRLDTLLKIALLITVLLVFYNAFTTATFANVIGRLNARAVWVFCFLALIGVSSFYKRSDY